MQTITLANLDTVVARINRELPNADYSIEFAYGSPRLVRNGGSVSVSPRLSKAKLYEWMHAFLDGVDAARRTA